MNNNYQESRHTLPARMCHVRYTVEDRSDLRSSAKAVQWQTPTVLDRNCFRKLLFGRRKQPGISRLFRLLHWRCRKATTYHMNSCQSFKLITSVNSVSLRATCANKQVYIHKPIILKCIKFCIYLFIPTLSKYKT